jgi:hypothetical protein
MTTSHAACGHQGRTLMRRRPRLSQRVRTEGSGQILRGGGERGGGERGEALLFAVFALLLLSISLALLTLTMRLRIEEQQREARRVRLDLLLDGALAETLARLAIDPRFDGVAPRPGEDGGEGWSVVERVGLHRARVEAGASLGGRRASGHADVRIVPGRPVVERWERGSPDVR